MTERQRVHTWMRLYSEFFDSGLCRQILDQKGCDGMHALVIYFWLCTRTSGTGGRLSRQSGSREEQMTAQELTALFGAVSSREMLAALAVLEQYGLLVRDEDGILKIAGWQELVESETGSAREMRARRAGRRVESLPWEPPSGRGRGRPGAQEGTGRKS